MPPNVEIMPIGSDDSQRRNDDVEKIVGDQSYDFLGRPARKNKTGTWRAVPFIFGMDLGETIATLGITLNLVGYLTTKLNVSPSRAANIMTNFMGTNYLLTVVWGFIADSFLGKFWTVTISSLILLSGLTLLTLSVALPSLRPDKCDQSISSSCQPASDREMTPIYIALYLVALGSGGVKPSISVLGADQFDDTIPDEKLQGTHFFNWFFYFIQVGSFTSVTFLVYVQDNVGFSWGYGILWGLFFITMVGFFVGSPFYRHKIPSGSAGTRVLQVLYASLRKMKLHTPKHPNELYELRDQDVSAIKGSRKLKHTTKFKFLDKAAIVTRRDHIEEPNRAPNPWRMCTVTQVEELKRIMQMIPIWATSCIVYTLFAQLTSFSLYQGKTLNRHLGSGFEIPPASLPVFALVVVLLCVPLYDIVFVPFTRQFTGYERGITPLQRIGIGIFISVFAMMSAALVEARRVRIIRQLGLQRQDTGSVSDLPMSIFWLVPQFAILGFTEMFTAVGQLEFFYSEAPDGMRGIATSFYYTAISVGYFMSSAIVSIVNSVTRSRDEGSWLGDDLNDGGLELFFWLLTVIIFVDLVLYLGASHWYTYKQIEKPAAEQDQSLEVEAGLGYSAL
ncbi:hypothetical protein Mapa_002069 [Marchantia paleacea]|nr:hypothetical protein Mapa_002069 [Marchantia paleacea]